MFPFAIGAVLAAAVGAGWDIVSVLLPRSLVKVLVDWSPLLAFGWFIALSVSAGDIWRTVKGRRLKWNAAIAGCAHGVKGARAEPNLCPECTAAIERRREALREAFSRLETLQAMSPMGFQRLVWQMYRALGYSVRETPAGRDGGVDGFLGKDGKNLVLQCKRYQSDVSEPILRDLFGTLHHHNADGAVLVTTGSVTGPAVKFADGKALEIVDGDELLRLLKKANLDPLKFGEMPVSE